jgi:hypothetical protein
MVGSCGREQHRVFAALADRRDRFLDQRRDVLLDLDVEMLARERLEGFLECRNPKSSPSKGKRAVTGRIELVAGVELAQLREAVV